MRDNEKRHYEERVSGLGSRVSYKTLDARLGKNGAGRNAGKDRAETQGCLRQEV